MHSNRQRYALLPTDYTWSHRSKEEEHRVLVPSWKRDAGVMPYLWRQLPEGFRQSAEAEMLKQLGCLLAHMLAVHHTAMCLIFVSFMLCVIAGAVHEEYVDGSLYKSIGMLLAVLLSLRAKNAISRRQMLMSGVLTMMNSAKTLLWITTLESGEKRKRLRNMLAFCFQEVAAFVRNSEEIAEEDQEAQSRMESLDVGDRAFAFLLRGRGKGRLRTSPRCLLLFLREFCDELFDPEEMTRRACCGVRLSGTTVAAASAEEEKPKDGGKIDKVSVIRRYHRNFEEELHTLIRQYDMMCMFREELLTTQFRVMLSFVICLYVALYPWCVRDESTLVLGATTIGMAFVFYGLNAMTEQLEDPVLQAGQGFNLSLTFKRMFAELEREEAMREDCAAFLMEKRRDCEELTEDLHRQFTERFGARLSNGEEGERAAFRGRAP